MKICKNCNIECADDAKFCQECGYHFTEEDKPVKVCKNCNTHNPETSKFYQECGEPFEKASALAQTETVSVEPPTTDGESESIVKPASEALEVTAEIPPVTDSVTRVDDNISQPTTHQTETKTQTESEPVKEFNIAEILANDPYYDDVPLEDKGETKTPIDKENIKKSIFIVVGALLFVVAITVALVITS